MGFARFGFNSSTQEFRLEVTINIYESFCRQDARGDRDANQTGGGPEALTECSAQGRDSGALPAPSMAHDLRRASPNCVSGKTTPLPIHLPAQPADQMRAEGKEQ